MSIININAFKNEGAGVDTSKPLYSNTDKEKGQEISIWVKRGQRGNYLSVQVKTGDDCYFRQQGEGGLIICGDAPDGPEDDIPF